MLRFIEAKIYRASVFLLAWSLLRFDRRYGGKNQDLTSGCTLVKVSGKSYSLRWLLAKTDLITRNSTDDSSRLTQLIRRMDRAEEQGKSLLRPRNQACGVDQIK